MTNSQQLINYINENGVDKKWLDLAIQFNIKPDGNNEQRYKAANDIWRNYNKSLLKNVEDKNLKTEEVVKPKLKLKSTWQVQKKGGEIAWLESYKAEEDFTSVETLEAYSKAFKEALDVESIDIPTEPIRDEKALFVYVSDAHVGASVESLMFSNRYNEDVFTSRLYDVLFKIKQLKSSQGKFDRLVMCDLGDSLDSYRNLTVRGGHHLPSNMTNLEMFKVYLSAYKRIIDDIVVSEIANNYTLLHVPGNHAGDVDTMVHIALKEYVKGRYPQIDFLIPERTFIKYEYGKHGFLFTHGKDKEHMKTGLPIDLDVKTENLLLQVIAEFDLDNKYKHIVSGDKHISSEKYGKFFRYKKVGSLFGSSDHIHANFGNTRPSCDYEIVYKHTNDILKGRIEW